MRTLKNYLQIGLIAATLAVSGAAWGQQDSTAALEEITVFAQKRAENITDVPVALNVIGQEKLDEEHLNNIESLTRIATSLNIVSDNINIRGVGTVGFSTQIEPSVAFAVDGVVLARSGQAFVNLLDVERVEVLRGSQGTLFGKNASAGLVQIITRSPTDEFSVDTEVQVVEGDETVVKAVVSGPLSDNVGGSVSTYYENVDDFTPNAATGDDKNGTEAFTLRGKIEGDVTEQLQMRAIAFVRKQDINGNELQWREITDPALQQIVGSLGVTPSDENDTTTSDGSGYRDIEELGAQFEFNYETDSGNTVTSLTAYSNWELRQQDDVDEQPIDLRTPIFITPIPSPLGTVGPVNFAQSTGQDIDQFSQEIRLTSDVNDRLSYIAGAYAQVYELDDTVRRDFDVCLYPSALGFPIPPSLPPLQPGDDCFDPANSVASLSTLNSLAFMGNIRGVPALTITELSRNVKGQNYALFGQGSYQVGDSIEWIFGLRYQYDNTDLDFDVTIPNMVPGFGFQQPDMGAVRGSVDGSGGSGLLGLTFDVTDNTMMYAKYTRGYKGPTGEIRPAGFVNQNPDEAIIEIDPETSDNFEVGLKTGFRDGRGYLALTGFFSDYTDYQAEQYSAADQTFVLANVGEVETSGVELELFSRFDSGWGFDASVSYVKAEIKDYPNARCYAPETSDPDCSATPPFSKNLKGGVMPNTPELKAYVNGRYDHEFASGKHRGFVQVSYSWQDDVQFSLDQNPATIQEAYGLLNASIGFGSQDDRYLLTLFGRNLTGEDHVASMFQDFITTGSRNIVHFRPKNADTLLGASLRVRF